MSSTFNVEPSAVFSRMASTSTVNIVVSCVTVKVYCNLGGGTCPLLFYASTPEPDRGGQQTKLRLCQSLGRLSGGTDGRTVSSDSGNDLGSPSLLPAPLKFPPSAGSLVAPGAAAAACTPDRSDPPSLSFPFPHPDDDDDDDEDDDEDDGPNSLHIERKIHHNA